MKFTKILSIALFAVACVIASGTAAQAKESKNMVLQHDFTLAGSQLASGKYNVQWQGDNTQATVSFLRGSKVVATAAGKLVDRGKKSDADQVLYDEAADGTRVIREIRFRGSSEVIEINQ
jgi:hypothetical protein